MGVFFNEMESYYEFSSNRPNPEHPGQVVSLAEKSLLPLIQKGLPNNLTHIIVATSCPDSIAPSVGQVLNEKYNSLFSECHTIDIVQGCAGGVTALILGSQLSELNKSSVLIIQSDAAKKATSKSNKNYANFGNGSFSCIISYEESTKGLMQYKSRQYKNLSEVVSIKLGHDADSIIKSEKQITVDPRKYLGLNMNNTLAVKLFKNAESFYQEFISQSQKPDIMILHHVNSLILNHLRTVFEKYDLKFIDISSKTGNCGAASVGIALDSIKDSISGKKIFLCSFGTGGVITAGLWQN